MGIFKKESRHLNKLKEQSPYEYDALKATDRHSALRDRFTRSLLVNSVWYAGNDLELKQLYERDLKAFKEGNFTSETLNYFWAQTTEGTNIRKIHSGLPQLISEKMVDLVTSNGYEIAVYKDEELDERDEENEERLLNALNDNDWQSLHGEAIETESWSGGVAIKLSVNKLFDYPIIEIIQPEEYEPVVYAGRIIEDIFIKYYNRKDTTYKLKERYGVDDLGGFIKYELYKYSNDEWISCALTEIEETKDLKDFSFKGVYEKFSIYKPNKLPNSEFRGSKLGESDYSGSHGLFDAIDEIVSTMVQEFRDGKIKNFWASNLLPIDPTTNQQYIPPALAKDFIVYNGGIGEREKPTAFEQTQGDIHSEKYLESYKKLLESVLNNAGLSPQTIGVTGLESSAASEESQELREKTSIRTREKKVDLWTKTMEKLFELVLKLDDIKNNRTPDDYLIKVTFNDYKIQTLDDRTDIASKGLASKSWDIKSAVDYVHNEMTDDERILMRVNIKIENGINIFTKEEEIVYKKYVAEVVAEEPVVEQEIEEEPAIEIEDVQEEVEVDDIE